MSIFIGTVGLVGGYFLGSATTRFGGEAAEEILPELISISRKTAHLVGSITANGLLFYFLGYTSFASGAKFTTTLISISHCGDVGGREEIESSHHEGMRNQPLAPTTYITSAFLALIGKFAINSTFGMIISSYAAFYETRNVYLLRNGNPIISQITEELANVLMQLERIGRNN